MKAGETEGSGKMRTAAMIFRHYPNKIPFSLIQRLSPRSTELETNLPSRKPILPWLIISHVLALASLVVWLLMAGLSVMAFDSGVTQEAWNFVIAVWLYPIWPIVFAVASWVAYRRKKDKLACVLTTFTFLPILVLLLIIIGANYFYIMIA